MYSPGDAIVTAIDCFCNVQLGIDEVACSCINPLQVPRVQHCMPNDGHPCSTLDKSEWLCYS